MSKSIVVYYSLEGNVDFVARKIAEKINADLLRLETVKEYPKSGLLKFFHGGKDVIKGVKPELKTQIPSLADYDIVITGAPVWAAKPATPVRSFFEKADLTGKKCLAFASSGGGNARKCIAIMEEEIISRGGSFEGSAEFTNPLKKQEAALQVVEDFVQQIKAL